MTTIPPEQPGDSLRLLQERLAAGDGVPGLHEILDSAVSLFGVAGGAVLLGDSEERVLRAIVATSEIAHDLASAQVDAGEGPTVDAFLHGRLVESADLRTDERWRAARDARADLSIGAAACAPVSLSGIAVGALQLHAAGPRPWSEADRRALASYSEVIGSILASAVVAQRANELAAQLAHALEYRVVIERGIGYLMASEGLEPAAAFEKLRRVARDSRRKISDLAEQLLSTGKLSAD